MKPLIHLENYPEAPKARLRHHNRNIFYPVKEISVRTLVTFFLAAGFAACTSYTSLTGSWINSKTPVKSYHSIFVMAMSGHAVQKSMTEADFSAELNKCGIITYRSLDEFPPSLGKDSIDKTALSDLLKSKNVDAILTISLLRKETESRYVPGNNYYNPVMFGYYTNLWGYYNYWYPNVYGQGYYVTDRVYYIETNLYNAATEELVWSAQSRTYNPVNLHKASREFAALMVRQMKADGVFNQTNLVLGK